MTETRGSRALLAEYARGVHYAFVEAVRRANEAVRQRDYYRRRAIDAECARRDAAGECPDLADDPCPRAFGLRCRACVDAVDKEARYL
jgi:uncharacterized protein YqfA (UPF0365 family)